MVFHGMEPWGVLSLKHAAEKAGLGAFGRSGQLYHPRHGALLRLGAVITTVAIEGDTLIDDMPCPEDCTACIKACPVNAIKNKREKFEKMTCLAHTIKHAIYPLALKSEVGRKRIERVINTAGYDYWLECFSCVQACPLNEAQR
jgi:epoxyqueuosine reductase QueG